MNEEVEEILTAEKTNAGEFWIPSFDVSVSVTLPALHLNLTPCLSHTEIGSGFLCEIETFPVNNWIF